MSNEWTLVLESDDDSIDSDMVSWAGIEDLWEADDFGSGLSFELDFFPFCDHLHVEEEEWDADFPGRSGINYKVYSDNPEMLREEIRDRFSALRNPPPAPPIQRLDDMSGIHSIPDAADRLQAWAKHYRNLRVPGGYQGIGNAAAGILSFASKQLLESPTTLAGAASVLLELANAHAREPSASRSLQQIASRLEALASEGDVSALVENPEQGPT